MIGYLKGEILSKKEGLLIVATHGVGWRVNTTQFQTFVKGDTIEIFVYTSVKENDISLWGFENEIDLRVFELLLGVNGVGNKTAQQLITVKGTLNILSAIRSENLEQLKVSGVGTKTLQKIQIELTSKIAKLDINMPELEINDATSEEKKILAQVEEGLSVLGYSSLEIERAVKKIDKSKITVKNLQSLIKEALKNI